MASPKRDAVAADHLHVGKELHAGIRAVLYLAAHRAQAHRLLYRLLVYFVAGGVHDLLHFRYKIREQLRQLLEIKAE